MRNKTLASLLILCGSTAAFAAIPQGNAPLFQDIPQNNSATPPGDKWAPDAANNGVTPADTPDAPKPDASKTDDKPPEAQPQR